MSEKTTEKIQNDETLEQPTLADIMKVLNGFIKESSEQFEAIREGIAHNASHFDRLEAKIYSVQSDISHLKADVRDLTEEVRRWRKILA